MERVHPIHIVTLTAAIIGAIFAFVAMRVAFEAREAAWSAAGSAANGAGDSSHEIWQLQTALIRAGVIEDPNVIPDDHGELDGPWSRCLTGDERDELGHDADEVDLPPPCEAVPVSFEEECPEPVPASELGEDEAVDDACELAYVVGRQRFNSWDHAHPVDVAAEADEWLRADSSHDVDRVARGPDATFVHTIGEGWLRLYEDQ